MIGLVLALASLAAWLKLWLFQGRFWEATTAPAAPPPAEWPGVVVVIPARNEAEGIGAAVGSHLRQAYPGRLRVVVVDDQSTDGTADLAWAAAEAAGAADRLTVISGAPLPPGWVGKMWAVSQGVAAAERANPEARWILLTDGDIVHRPNNVAQLVARGEADRLDLVSLMVRLRCVDFAERWLVPPFVFFFKMLYPFAWVNRADKATAGAAGGCMLVRREALARIGGIAVLRDALIDDCTLATALKRNGRIRLDLTDEAESLRVYGDVGEIWRMVARTAYTQLRYSPWLLLGTIAGLIVTYIAPPALTLLGEGAARYVALAAWAIMSATYLPMLRFYRRSPLWAPFLPLAAVVYLGATIDSARRHWAGVGGAWKGRVYDQPGAAPDLSRQPSDPSP
ncbi:MAG: glycosyltransferase [Inquilinus limosus]|uniref:Glycosyltransferase n=1 Tax=Inquilinus limosus TaxID=171674 RepID=A0A952FSH2_9PROT|nr:glycosyltransferase [Inquilinus limosus]